MRLRYGTARLADALRALRTARQLAPRERWSRQRLAEHQRRALHTLIAHATAHSAFYRDHYAGVDLDDTPALADLPSTTKGALMERFDDWVCDPRLRLADVERHLDGLVRDELLYDQYRAMATGGTTGRRGIFVYSRAEWVVCLAGFLRWTELTGTGPRLPRRRVAAIGATSPLHMTARFGMTIDVGAHRVLRLDARQPLGELVAALDSFRPDFITGYPSVLALLADEQVAGRLQVAPERVATTSEVRTAEMEAAITRAWEVTPYNAYGITEGGIVAADCAEHAGLHLFEDLVLFENVDEDGRPVPDGTVGAKLLVTNLFNRTQPLIRYELSDMVALDSSPCACGRTLARVVALDGRSDDILVLPRAGEGEVAVHPLTVRSLFAGMAELRQYQVVQDPQALRVRVALRDGVDAGQAAARIRSAVAAKLEEVGAVPPPIEVEAVAEIVRDSGHGAKLKLIESRVR